MKTRNPVALAIPAALLCLLLGGAPGTPEARTPAPATPSPQQLEEEFARTLEAARGGDAMAQNNVGVMYAQGRGVAASQAEALRWYVEAAIQNNAVAQCNLASVYRYGREVPRDYAEAIRWYRKSALGGFAKAKNALGEMYLEGEGVDADPVAAAEWYMQSALTGDADGQAAYGACVATGAGVEQDDAVAAGWLRKAADQNSPRGQLFLAVMAQTGRGMPRNEAAAKGWYDKAAAQKNPAAYNSVAWQLAVAGQNLDEALSLVNQSLELKSQGYVLDTLAYIQMKRRDFPAALVAIDKAVEMDPEDPGPRLRRMEIDLAAGDRAAAAREFAEIEKMDKGLFVGRAAKWREEMRKKIEPAP